MPGSQNPADLVSRGASNINDFVTCKYWREGPLYLSRREEFRPSHFVFSSLPIDDTELKSIVFICKQPNNVANGTDILMKFTSNWNKLKFRVAVFRKYFNFLKIGYVDKCISVVSICKAKLAIYRSIQVSIFSETYLLLQSGKQLRKCDSLTRFRPFIDDDGVIRVGDRLACAPAPYESKHLVLLPTNCHATCLLVECTHRELGHMDREYVLAHLRLKAHIVAGLSRKYCVNV